LVSTKPYNIITILINCGKVTTWKKEKYRSTDDTNIEIKRGNYYEKLRRK